MRVSRFDHRLGGLRGDLVFSRRRRDEALVGDLGQLLDDVFVVILRLDRLLLTTGCWSRFRGSAGPPRLLTARAFVAARRLFLRARELLVARLTEINLVLLLHELGEVRDVEEGVAF